MNTLQSILDTASSFSSAREIVSYLKIYLCITNNNNNNPDFIILVANLEQQTYTLKISRTANSLQHNVDLLNLDSILYSTSRIICF